MRTDERARKAIKYLRGEPEFQAFRSWLEQELEANDLDLRKVSPEMLGHYQGRAAILTAIITLTAPRESGAKE